MRRIYNFVRVHWDIVSYLLFGALTTLVNLVAVYLLEYIFGSGGKGYIVYNAIAWVVAVVFAYITNKLYVFESKSWAPKIVIKESAQFLLARVFSFLVEEFGLILMVEVLNFAEYSLDLKIITLSGATVAKIILAVIVVIMNYFFSKFIIFKKKQ